MKKRIVCFLTGITLIFTLIGCGQTVKQPTGEMATEQDDIVKEEASSNDDTEEPSDTKDEEAMAPMDSNEEDVLRVFLTNVNMTASDDEHERYRIVDMKYTKVSLDEKDASSYPELAKTLDEINQKQETYFATEMKAQKEAYMEYETDFENKDYPTYETTVLNQVLRADTKVLSLLENNYSYQGGAHGYCSVYGKAYDVVTGQELSLSDVIADEKAFKQLMRERLLEAYPETMLFVDPETYFDEVALEGEEELSWSIDYSGITVYFEPYEIASYADGILTVRFSFAEDNAIINETYQVVPEDYITPITTWTSAYADLNQDGMEERIDLNGMVQEEWDASQWILKIGEDEMIDPVYSYEDESYLVRKDGKVYAYMFHTVENDYQILSVMDMETGKALGEEYEFSNYGFSTKDFGYDENMFWDTKAAFLNPDSFVLDSRLDVLGTYAGEKTYHVSKTGVPETEEEFYHVNHMGYLISSTEDIPCKLVDKEGNVLDENGRLPKDTMLRIIRTDGESSVDLQAGDYAIAENENFSEEYPYWYTEEPIDLNRGTFYRIEFETVDYEKLVDGESILGLFRGMMFAG